MIFQRVSGCLMLTKSKGFERTCLVGSKAPRFILMGTLNSFLKIKKCQNVLIVIQLSKNF